MSFSASALNDAVDGVTGGAPYLSLHTGNPGTTGANRDTGVDLVEAGWDPASSGSASSAQVAFTIDPGGGTRTYTHFGAWADEAATVFKFGGQLDEAEQFSDAGGTYNFTATVSAAEAS